MLFNIKEEIERMSKLHCQMMESYQKFFDSFTRSIPSGFDILDGGRKLEDYKEEQCGDTCHWHDKEGNEVSSTEMLDNFWTNRAKTFARDTIENDIKSFKWKCCDEDTKVKNILDEIEEERQKRREACRKESSERLNSNVNMALKACKNDYEKELESTKNDPADKEFYAEIDKRIEKNREKTFSCGYYSSYGDNGCKKYNKDDIKINPNEKFQDAADKIVIKDSINRLGLSMRDQIRSTAWGSFIGDEGTKEDRHLSYLALLVKTILRVFGHTSVKSDTMYGVTDIYNKKFANLVNTIELSDNLIDATARFRGLISPIRLTADECSTSLKSVNGKSETVKTKTWEFKAGKSYFEIKTITESEDDVKVIFTIEDKDFDKDIVFTIDSKTDFETVFKQIIIHAKNLPETTIKAL